MHNAIRSFVLASVVLASAAFTAQIAMAAATLYVPFAFTVGNQTFPAGRYTVVRDDSTSRVRLVGATKSFTWGIRPGDFSPSYNHVVLKFDDLGSTHTLRAIQYGSMTTSQLDKRKPGQKGRSSEIALGK